VIERKARKTRATFAVTFTVPAPTDSKQRISVVGDFNEWDRTAHLLKGKKGAETRAVTLTLPAGTCYRFRYVTDDGQWFDDETADRFEPNDFGGKNGVLDLTGAGAASG
jgi:1,4-alpha-glucan branching enzyme